MIKGSNLKCRRLAYTVTEESPTALDIGIFSMSLISPEYCDDIDGWLRNSHIFNMIILYGKNPAVKHYDFGFNYI